MPIFEFQCKKCRKTFETLVISSDEWEKIRCPQCGTGKPQKLMSMFSGGKSGGSTCSASSCSGCSVRCRR